MNEVNLKSIISTQNASRNKFLGAAISGYKNQIEKYKLDEQEQARRVLAEQEETDKAM